MKQNTPTPCVFFDRDGIVNHPPDDVRRYVTHEDEFDLLPGFVDSLRIALDRGYKAVIVTNQSGVARGRMSDSDLERIHAKLDRLLEAEGLAVHDILVCTALDDAHTHRKPNPGMLLEAAERHHLDLGRSWMIGDQEKDVTAGKRAGVHKTVKVKSLPTPTHADYRVGSMRDLPALLQAHLPAVSGGAPKAAQGKIRSTKS